jgi:alpha-tubulin suppressor-like RCC1 family protein
VGQIGNRSGRNECQSIPIKLNGFNDEKVFMISSGHYYDLMVLTESGRIFSWGHKLYWTIGSQ